MLPNLPNTSEKLESLKDGALNQARGGWGAEFREFIARGNVVDLTVGVSIGTAFGKLIESFIQNIVTPPIRMGMSAIKGAANTAAGALPVDFDTPTTGPGAFLGQIGSFLLLAGATFLAIKVLNRFKRGLEARAQMVSPKADAQPEIEDSTVRQIAQNERIIELLEKLNSKQNSL